MIVVNFGGPRNLNEVPSFLTELLSDQDVIQTKWPKMIHRWFFTRVAKKRAQKIAPDYEKIGGGSPIYRDTEEIGRVLQNKLSVPVFTFHRYLRTTHEEFFRKIEGCGEKILRVLPLFPQFSYATTGSIARIFSERLSKRAIQSLHWIQSYPAHPAFINSYYQRIARVLKEAKVQEEESLLLFSCHGVPRSFIDQGDIYESECNRSFEAISSLFPAAVCKLSYQSKFGRGEWLRPYTDEVCESLSSWDQGRKTVVVVPLSFTSDHIETLYEIEELYLPVLRKNGAVALRCPALNLESEWIDALVQIAQSDCLNANSMLIRK
jgi:protoporphyrin/coproporphyrin ferrochelatase